MYIKINTGICTAASRISCGYLIIIIIITLFEEDNIFDRYVILTYGPQLTDI